MSYTAPDTGAGARAGARSRGARGASSLALRQLLAWHRSRRDVAPSRKRARPRECEREHAAQAARRVVVPVAPVAPMATATAAAAPAAATDVQAAPEESTA